MPCMRGEKRPCKTPCNHHAPCVPMPRIHHRSSHHQRGTHEGIERHRESSARKPPCSHQQAPQPRSHQPKPRAGRLPHAERTIQRDRESREARSGIDSIQSISPESAPNSARKPPPLQHFSTAPEGHQKQPIRPPSAPHQIISNTLSRGEDVPPPSRPDLASTAEHPTQHPFTSSEPLNP